MSARSLTEHLGYWLDRAKLAGYKAALEEVVQPGDRVLDLGTGTGLLGMLAVRAGAGKVWSVDSGDILGVARDIAVANGLADRMEFVSGLSTEIELPEVDVVVCDQIGGLAFDAGVLEYFADAKLRALRDGGVLLPGHFELFLVPVEAQIPYLQVDRWDGTNVGFDLGPVRRLAANTEFRIGPDDIALLANGKSIANVESSCSEPIKASRSWRADRSGTIHGLSGWFTAMLSPSVSLTNDPSDLERMNRWLNFYPVEHPIRVEEGEKIEATIDIRSQGKLVTWSVGAEGTKTQRMSTFAGKFLFSAQTHSQPGDQRANSRDHRHAAMADLLHLAAGKASEHQLIEAAIAHSQAFATDEAAARFARQVNSMLD